MSFVFEHATITIFVLYLVPPLWYYLVDPRVDALRDLQNGKKSKNCYNFISPFSPEDKRCQAVGWASLAIFQLILTYGSFAS